MPAYVREILGEVRIGWKEGFIDDDVGHPIVLEESQRLIVQPGLVPELSINISIVRSSFPSVTISPYSFDLVL